MSAVLTWIVRFGHVLGAACWVGGYALLALVLIPRLAREPDRRLAWIAASGVRLLTYSGTLTIGFGLVLITRTRGMENLLRGEWGALVLMSALLAVALMGIGDGALRPAIARLAAGGDGTAARRWALAGFGVTVLAVALMTRALYATS